MEMNIIQSLLDASEQKEVLIKEPIFRLFCDLTEADFKYFQQKKLISLEKGEIRIPVSFSETDRIIESLPSLSQKKDIYLTLYSNPRKFFSEEELENFELTHSEINYQAKEFLVPQMFFLFYCNLKMQDVSTLEFLDYFKPEDSASFGRGGKKFITIKMKNIESERALLKYPTREKRLLMHTISAMGEHQVLDWKEKSEIQYIQEQIIKMIGGPASNKTQISPAAAILEALKEPRRTKE